MSLINTCTCNSWLRILTVGRRMVWLEALIDFSLTVKAATLIFISGSAISSAKEGK